MTKTSRRAPAPTLADRRTARRLLSRLKLPGQVRDIAVTLELDRFWLTIARPLPSELRRQLAPWLAELAAHRARRRIERVR
jgi:hypothetical protein